MMFPCLCVDININLSAIIPTKQKRMQIENSLESDRFE